MLRPWRARGHSGGAFVSCRKAETEEEKVKCKASKRASEGITFSGEWFAGYHAERQTRRGLRRLGARCRQVQRRLVRRFRGWRDSTRGRRKQARTLASHWRHISLAVWRVSFARASWSISLFSDLLLAEVDIAFLRVAQYGLSIAEPAFCQTHWCCPSIGAIAHLPRRSWMRRGCRWQLCYEPQLRAGKQSRQPTKQDVAVSVAMHAARCLRLLLWWIACLESSQLVAVRPPIGPISKQTEVFWT
jgi:hypothetical protein